jgi:hypothetical protein
MTGDQETRKTTKYGGLFTAWGSIDGLGLTKCDDVGYWSFRQHISAVASTHSGDVFCCEILQKMEATRCSRDVLISRLVL